MADDSKKEGFSFSFSKKKANKLLTNTKLAKNEQQVSPEKDYILSVNEKAVVSKKKKEVEKDLIIPLIQTNRWRQARKPEDLEKEETDTKKKDPSPIKTQESQDEAVQELLKEAAARKEDWDNRDGQKDRGMAIPLLMQNKVPEGFETDDKLNVDLRPDEPEDADYDAIPIEQYGLALLRGMGWKTGEGVGKNQKDVKLVDAVPRPKGLGLGADKSVALQAQGKKVADGDDGDKKEELPMKKGAYCLVISGKHADLYGVAEGLDEDNNRVMLKLALSGETINISQLIVQTVSKKDYDKYSKYLNKAKVDKFKEEQSKKYSSHDSGSESDRRKHKRKHKNRSRSRSQDKDYKKSRRSDSRERSRSPRKEERDRKRRSRSREKKKDKREKSKAESSHMNGSSRNPLWLHPHLRVRIVDPDYKKGKYYKAKVIIEDVFSAENCICRTDEGQILEDISQSMLETVIPRSENAYIMITAGKYTRQFGEVLRRDKAAGLATVQLLKDRDIVKELDFNHICEYTGDIHASADF